jgi:hypothetical protein
VVLEWYAEGLETLLRLLRTVDPAAQAWNFLAAAPTAAFWGRRMAHETAIHRWDAELATGSPAPFAPSVSAPGTFDPVFAADGIDEVLGTFLPGAAGPLRPPAPDGSGPPLGTVHVHLTDVPGGEWLVTFTTDGIHTERRHAKADTAVRGPAAQVYLSSWGREPQPQILGDEALASAVVWNG